MRPIAMRETKSLACVSRFGTFALGGRKYSSLALDGVVPTNAIAPLRAMSAAIPESNVALE